MRYIFFGTPSIAASILQSLLDAGLRPVAIVTQTAKKSGRGQAVRSSSVALLAKKESIPLFEPHKASDPKFIGEIADLKPDLSIVVAYGKILTQTLLDIPKFGSINVHASLLPKYRGAAPMQRALMAGDVVTGVTIMKMVRALDAGDMLIKREISVSDEMTLGELEVATAKEGAGALLEALKLYKGSEPKAEKQDESLVTYADKILPEERKLDFRAPAKKVHNQIRGLSPRPGAYAFIEMHSKRKQVKVFKTRLVGAPSAKELEDSIEFERSPGRAFVDSNNLYVLVGPEGEEVLQILELQLEGKKRLFSREFLRGLGKVDNYLQLS